MPRIKKPVNSREALHNVRFQLDNIEGFMEVGDKECALIKAGNLKDELEVFTTFLTIEINSKANV